MKKFLCLILGLLLVVSMFSFVACEDNDQDEDSGKSKGTKYLEEFQGMSPEELYDSALTKIEAYTNYEAEVEQIIKMQGQTVNQTIISKLDGQNCYAKMDSEASSYLNMECWFVDGVFYYSQGGSKIKAEITYEEYMEKYMPEGAQSMAMPIPESWFVDTRFVKDGKKVYIELTVSGDEYLAYMEGVGLSGITAAADLDDIVYTIYFTETGDIDYIKTDISMTVSGYEATATSICRYKNVGSTTITAPADADSYMQGSL